MMRVKVLFLSANAGRTSRSLQRDAPPETGERRQDLSWLDIDREYNGVQDALQFPGLRGSHVVEMIPDLRWGQFLTILHDSAFRFVLHFSGHGDENGGLYMKNDQGTVIRIELEQLVGAIRRHKERIALVVLNACYSAQLAKALADDVGLVIGMEQRVADLAAIPFSKRFYDRLVNSGETVKLAFDEARAFVDGEYPGALAGTQLHVRAGVDPSLIRLFTPLRERVPDDAMRQLLKSKFEQLLPANRHPDMSAAERDVLIERLTAMDESIGVMLDGMRTVEGNTRHTDMPSGFKLLEASVIEAQKGVAAFKDVLIAARSISNATPMSTMR
jgi:hypothetical protein